MHENIQANGTREDNNTTPMFIGLNGSRKKKMDEKIKREVFNQMYFNMNDENAVRFEYFNSRTN